jgi:transcriptional regulator with XRE-family HTH domain
VDDEDGDVMPHAAGLDSVAGRIGPRIRARRIELGISLREFARRIGVSASFLSRVETGRTSPSVGTLCAMTSELGISADELLAEPGDPAPRR